MNKYQEALDFLIEEAYENYNKKNIQTREDKEKIFNDYGVLKKLVDRATPKKPKIKKVEYYCGEDPCEQEYEYKCSNCCGWVGNEYHHDKFCASCGQAIDWINENEDSN